MVKAIVKMLRVWTMIVVVVALVLAVNYIDTQNKLIDNVQQEFNSRIEGK